MVFFTMSSAFGADSVQILYKCNGTNQSTNTLEPWFEVVNNGTTNISLQRVKIRYWYTKDSTSSQVFVCDWAQVGTANVSGSIIQMGNPTSTADNYLEISFSSNAGSLTPGSNSGEIKNRIHRNDWTNYNQSNDFSFNPSFTSYGQNLNVTGYLDGTLVFGTEPSTDNQAPSPPVNLSYNITSSTSIYLSWQASTDNVGVTGYIIYRDDVEVGDTNGPTTYYRDSGLTPANSYTYTVKAYDAVRNLSAASNALGAPTDGTLTNGFLVFVASPLYYTGNVSSKISQYMTDISGQWTPKLIKINNVQSLGAPANWICQTPNDLKEIIKDFGNQGYKGFVLIGSAPSIPSALWKQKGAEGDSGASDLYYADINGEWNDVDADGYLDSLSPVSGLPQNPDFETVSGGLPSNWTTSGGSTFSADNTTHQSGNYSAKIVSASSVDSSFQQTISVTPNSTYYFRGFVKTQNVVTSTGESGVGACISVGDVVSNSVQGTADWTEVVMQFHSGDNTTMTLKCRLGGPGNTCTGTAWFDNMHLYKDIGASFTPEMFFGRITAGPISTSLADEAAKVEAYFTRLHAYRAPGFVDSLPSRGIVYNEYEWCGQGDSMSLGMSTTLGEIRDINDPTLTSPEKMFSELELGCQYMLITNHGTPVSWQMDSWLDGCQSGRAITVAKLNTASPRVRYLTLNSCHSSLYTEANLGASFLFNNSYMLNVGGQALSTQGLWPQEGYYQEMGTTCIGNAFKAIVTQLLSNGDYRNTIAMVLLGDPTLRYLNPTRANVSPVVTTDLRWIESQKTQELVLPLTIVDPDSTSFTISVTGLPGATVDQPTRTIHWTPAANQLGATYSVTVQVNDSSGGKYVTDFPVYASFFKNGQLTVNPETVSNGWTVSVPGHIVGPGGGYFYPIYGLLTDADHRANSMTQTVTNLQTNTDYTLAFMARTNELTPFNAASVRIGTLVETTLNIDDPNFVYYTVRFNTGANTSLPITINAGSVSNPCTGNLYVTGLRLFPTPSYNFGFETVDGNLPARWWSEATSTTTLTTFTVETNLANVHSGSRSLKISSPALDYAKSVQPTVSVKPMTRYRLRGYIKTSGVTGAVCGANMIVTTYGLWATTPQIFGTNDWQLVEFEFDTGNNTCIRVECHLGDGDNLASGTVWFDDLTLVEL
jgi:hypothetical protein